MHFVRFGIVRIDAGVTDMRVCQLDNLAAVTGISEDFLISRQRSIEYHLTSSTPSRADGDTPENRSVLQCKNSEQPFIKGSNKNTPHFTPRTFKVNQRSARAAIHGTETRANNAAGTLPPVL